MWISKAVWDSWKLQVKEDGIQRYKLATRIGIVESENAALKSELVRHVADKDWFKHRLNQVEMERSQLIYAATGGYGQVPAVRNEGVKIPAPQFAEGPTMADTLNHQYNPFGTMGEDSLDSQDQIPGASAEDVSHMPGFKK